MKIEHSHPVFRSLDFSPTEVRGTSRFSATEVRDICASRPGFNELPDLRQIGCPDDIFERQVEQRARKLGVEPKQLPEAKLLDQALHASLPKDDLDRRLAEAAIF